MNAFINTAGLAAFGTITGGGGLSALFDGLTASMAWTESPNGWAGVSFDAPKSIGRIEVVSATNGFDASGLQSNITLRLYGKAGSAPSSGADGTLLAESAFKDVNATRTVTLESNDHSTLFDHAWITISTQVWVIVAELRLYEPKKPPAPLSKRRHVFMRSCNDSIALPHVGQEIPQYRVPLHLCEPRVVLIDYHVDVIHVGTGTDAKVPVGFGFGICKRSSETFAALKTEPFELIHNAIGGGNVSERNPQHYGNKTITTAISLPSGFHEISVLGTGHTDGSGTPGLLQILVEYGQGVNGLRVVVEPDDTVLHQPPPAA